MNYINIMQSMAIIIPIIMVCIFVAIIIIVLYKYGNLSDWYSSRSPGKIEVKHTSFKEIKIQKELEKLNYTCKYCKAELKGPKCEYCNRINFQI